MLGEYKRFFQLLAVLFGALLVLGLAEDGYYSRGLDALVGMLLALLFWGGLYVVIKRNWFLLKSFSVCWVCGFACVQMMLLGG